MNLKETIHYKTANPEDVIVIAKRLNSFLLKLNKTKVITVTII